VRFSALVFLAAATLIPSLQAQAQTTTAASPTTQPAATTPTTTDAANLDTVVCHTGVATTGSRLGSHRECHTQREWDRMRQDQQSSLVRTQTQITTTTRGN
jgi:hypothetical protein